MQRIVLLSSLLWCKLGTNSLITGSDCRFGVTPVNDPDPDKMRAHHIYCLTQQQFSNFPFNINWKKKKQTTLKGNTYIAFVGAV